MTSSLPREYVAIEHHLALGVEPIDAALGMRVSQPLAVLLDGVPFPKPPASTRPKSHWFEVDGALSRLARRSSGLYALLKGKLGADVTVRVLDRERRFVPRRIKVPLGPTGTRIVRPHFFPGAGYDVSRLATGIRGRVLSDLATQTPVRWVRITAELANGTIVGRAQGDDRGEFLLLLDENTLGAAAISLPVTVLVRVYAPAPAVPVPPQEPFQDPLWDLVAEELPAAPGAVDEVSTGRAVPPAYTEVPTSRSGVGATATPRTVQVSLGLLRTDEEPFYL